MELKIKPHPKNLYPLEGFLIREASVKTWLMELQALNYTLQAIQVYIIPNTTANSVWGCFVITNKILVANEIGKHEACQKVSPHFFIPEKAAIYPSLKLVEIESLFQSGIHILHPEFGLVELTQELKLAISLTEPIMKSYFVTKPEASVFIPSDVKQFQVKPVSAEDLIKHLEEKVFPKKEDMKDEKLNVFEQTKLAFYNFLFKRNKQEGKQGEGEKVVTEKTGLLSKFESMFQSFFKNEPKWMTKMQKDFEDLERRNQKQMDKLLDLLKNNPDEALKYAIPIDENGSVRGGEKSEFDLTRRWSDFSLFGNQTQGRGSGSIDLGDNFHVLRNQYNLTAQKLIEEKQYHKAAFVYMKLLKDNHSAASTLENAGFYQEAAVIYTKHCHNKQKAAECYEKGNMTNDAIELYKELNKFEKVGDLYASIRKQREADVYFEKVVDEYKERGQYIKASLIYKEKMHNATGGQQLLLQGWRTNKDAPNCLASYFANINDIKQLKTEIAAIYAHDLNNQNSEAFLQVIQNEYNKKNELSDYIKEMAYEVIAAQIPTNPLIVSEMKGFNKNDKELVKDALRFRVGKKK
jgi:hypothetical protein